MADNEEIRMRNVSKSECVCVCVRERCWKEASLWREWTGGGYSVNIVATFSLAFGWRTISNRYNNNLVNAAQGGVSNELGSFATCKMESLHSILYGCSALIPINHRLGTHSGTMNIPYNKAKENRKMLLQEGICVSHYRLNYMHIIQPHQKINLRVCEKCMRSTVTSTQMLMCEHIIVQNHNTNEPFAQQPKAEKRAASQPMNINIIATYSIWRAPTIVASPAHCILSLPFLVFRSLQECGLATNAATSLHTSQWEQDSCE